MENFVSQNYDAEAEFNHVKCEYFTNTDLHMFNEAEYLQGVQDMHHAALVETIGNNQPVDPFSQQPIMQEEAFTPYFGDYNLPCLPPNGWDGGQDQRQTLINTGFGFEVADHSMLPPAVPGGRAEGRIESPVQIGEQARAFGPEDLEKRPWTYAIDVWPAEDRTGQGHVLNHILAVQQSLAKKKVGYDFEIVSHSDDSSSRRYTLDQRHRNNELIRLDFLQVFNSNRAYNQKIPNYRIRMTVVFEPRQFHHGDNYATIADLDHDSSEANDAVNFSDHDVNNLGSYNPPAAPAFPSPEPHHELNFDPTTPQATVAGLPSPKDEQEMHTPQRSKPIPKPDREVVKNMEGKYCCTWPNCTEDIKEFKRKCEWSKHMDKHDRPYKCPAEGCEKLPGFTYSGGLLRHEREVHGKHGGPKNPLNCPHAFCKRHGGKGFSRLENLNEHLRRVHTSNHGATASGDEGHEGHDDNVSMLDDDQLAALAMPPMVNTILPSMPVAHVVGEKRKLDDDDDLRGEVKRLKEDKDLLSQKLEAQNRQSIAMMAEMRSMEATIRELRNQVANVAPESLLADTPQSFDS